MSAYPQAGIWRSMLGISWFWTVGSIWLAFIPPYVEGQLQADSTVANIFFAIFSLGVGLGAFICQRMLKGEITAKYVPLAGVGLSFSPFFLSVHNRSFTLRHLLSSPRGAC